MAKYRGPVCRLCRRAGVKLLLKGEKCYGPKCEIEKRNVPPGAHGEMRRKLSDYAVRLQEKQKARRTYGVMERQFKSYFSEATRHTGVTGEILLQLLERRLDNVIYRLGWAPSRKEARMLVTHRHFLLNSRPVNVPSILVTIGDVLAVKPVSRSKTGLKDHVEESQNRSIPTWLWKTPDGFEGKIMSIPARADIDTQVEEQLIVEYYSR
ncbi:MAG: 30S ribosomal protein S4 [Armatimonadetes bacterium]|nr:30S ribosomal protein S4 [Armatimonadota bacterium]